MKSRLSILIAVLFFFAAGCKKEGSDKLENKLKVTIDGVAKEYEIVTATLKNFSSHQGLSIITTPGLEQIDFYVNASTLETNIPYIQKWYLTTSKPNAVMYFREKLNPNDTYYSSVYTTDDAPDNSYNVTLTKLDGKSVAGNIKLKAGSIIVEGTFSAGNLVYE